MPHSGVAGPGASKMALPKDSQPLFQGEGGVQLSRMKTKDSTKYELKDKKSLLKNRRVKIT